MTMSEILVKRVADALLAQLAARSASYAALASSALPTQIKSFALAALKDAARDDIGRLSSAMFRYEQLPASLKESVAGALAETAMLSQPQLEAILQRSALLAYNLSTSPHQALVDVVFGESDEADAGAVVQKLERVKEHRYLVEVFLQYIVKKSVASLSREKAGRLVAEIDRRLCASYAPDEILRLFQPMYDFYALADEKEISIDILITFSIDKDVQPLAASLEKLKSRGAGALNFSDVGRAVGGEIDEMLVRLTPLPLAPKPLAPAFEVILMREVEAQLAAAEPPSKNSIAQPPDEFEEASQTVLDINKNQPPVAPQSTPNFTENIESAVSANVSAEASTESAEKAIEKEATSAAPKLSPTAPKRREESTTATRYLPPAPPLGVDAELDDLRVLITDDVRKKIIRRLFKGNETYYDAAIAELNQKKTWRESSLYIDEEIFTRYRVDEYSPEAVQFTDIIFNRYHRKP